MHYTQNRNNGFWPVAIAVGTMLNLALFVLLPKLERGTPVDPPPVMVVDFMEWQEPSKEPVKEQPPEPVKPKPKPPKKKPKPVKVKKPKPPEPKKIPAPVEKEPQPEQPPKQAAKPELTQEPVPEPKESPPVEPQQQEEPLPEPVPIFKVTAMPRIIHGETPVYPSTMRVTGKALVRVKLEVLIDAKGKVRKVSVIKSAGQLFDESAVNAMWASTFEPGKIDGKRVTVLMRTYVNFKLQ